MGRIISHFLDSGAFSIKRIADVYRQKHGGGRWVYYSTDAYRAFLDAYIRFLKKYEIGIDFYANMDVIGNPKLTWANQKYLEREGLHPIPIVHYGTDPDLIWMRRYIDRGYDYIGIGGLVGGLARRDLRQWLDKCFQLVCRPPSYLPTVKFHGFGVITHNALFRYPWYSVDATAWIKDAARGDIHVPYWVGGHWEFRPQILRKQRRRRYHLMVRVDDSSPYRSRSGRHIENYPPLEREFIKKWVEFTHIPFGQRDEGRKIIEEGVSNSYMKRAHANLLFFEHLRQSLPDWPWPFFIHSRRTLL